MVRPFPRFEIRGNTFKEDDFFFIYRDSLTIQIFLLFIFLDTASFFVFKF